MSSSILTNASALTALQALNATQKNMQTTENQISTGKKISTAADNAAYWSIGTKMSSQNSALGAVTDALNESAALLSTMTTALNSTLTIMTAIKNDLINAQQPGADLQSIQTDIDAQVQGLLSIGQAANFNGQNFLSNATGAAASTAGGTPVNVSLVAAYDGTNGVTSINVDLSKVALFDSPYSTAGAAAAGGTATAATSGILGGTTYNGVANASGKSILDINIYDTTGNPSAPVNATTAQISQFLSDVETAFARITTASSTLGATTTNVSNQKTFIASLSDSLTNGVSALVDADMNQASTRLSALQVQQQLGIQALSIANSNTQLILKLFQ